MPTTTEIRHLIDIVTDLPTDHADEHEEGSWSPAWPSWTVPATNTAGSVNC